MSKILVVGGAGYIGSHCCKALAKKGYTPVVYDSMIHGHSWAVKWGELEKGDILDNARLDEVLKKHQPEAVMHFAAFINVGESVTNPEKYFRNNVLGTKSLLESMTRNGVKKIVFSSTAAVFGEPEYTPIPEHHPRKPVNPYGENKFEIEKMLEGLATEKQIDSVLLRYFNAAGADPETEIGEDHDPETHLIPIVLETALGKRNRVTVYGSDYETRDGTCVRDYVHVSDLADAHLLALQAIQPGKCQAFNLGSERGATVKEVLASAEKITGKKIRTQMGPRRAGDPPTLVADSSKIKKELGWKPKYGDLNVILETAWEWTLKK